MNQIDKIAQSMLRKQLSSLGYYRIEFKNDFLGSSYRYLIADGDRRKILLALVTSRAASSKVSKELIKDAKNKAEIENREPWSATLQIDERGNLKSNSNIVWKNLGSTSA